MRVELDAFSGRPNPNWELTDQQSAEFLGLLQSLQPIPAESAAFEGLGYRGFVVTGHGETMNGFEQVRVFRGKVVATRRSGTAAFRDPQHSLEAWLLETGRSHIEQGTMAYVRKEIE